MQGRAVEKWVAENDKVLNTSVWLKFERADHDHVLSLKCAVCSRFKDKLVSMGNHRPTFVEGTTNVRTSLFKEHAVTNMHARAMVLFKKQQSSTVCKYAHQSRRRYCSHPRMTIYERALNESLTLRTGSQRRSYSR